jgi:peroxiredoxin
LRDSHSELEEAGVRVVMALCQKREAVARYLERNPTPFPLVTDEDRLLARGWGVYHGLGIDAINIARPASFVIDGEGVIRLADVSRNQFHSVAVEEILETLGGL